MPGSCTGDWDEARVAEHGRAVPVSRYSMNFVSEFAAAVGVGDRGG
ncbi:MAG TPA: hypothetical protein VHS54_07230 [Jatrophihabitans sp.]|jgi:hypothetical protein|nr:hypothetical protein [Jatrophihabitans sp.]